MKKVLFCGNFTYPSSNAAGERIKGLSMIFQDIGYESNFLCFNSNYDRETKGIMETNCLYFQKHKKIKRMFSSADYYSKFIDSVAKFNIIKNDIVVLYGTPSNYVFPKKVILYCLKNKIIVISDCVDWITRISNSIIVNTYKKIDNYIMKKIIFPRSNGIICISSYIYNMYDPKKNNLIIVPPVFQKSNLTNNTNNNQINFMYAGQPFDTSRIVNKRLFKDRLDLAIEAIIQLDIPYIFNIYGLSKADYLRNVQNHKLILNNNANIVFHGTINKSEMIKVLENTDYIVLFRNNNVVSSAGFSTKIAESISQNVPVITTDVGDNCRYLTHNIDSFIVDINDVYNIANLSNFIKNNVNFMKENCLKNNHFNYLYYVDIMNDFIKKLIKEN